MPTIFNMNISNILIKTIPQNDWSRIQLNRISETQLRRIYGIPPMDVQTAEHHRTLVKTIRSLKVYDSLTDEQVLKQLVKKAAAITGLSEKAILKDKDKPSFHVRLAILQALANGRGWKVKRALKVLGYQWTGGASSAPWRAARVLCKAGPDDFKRIYYALYDYVRTIK